MTALRSVSANNLLERQRPFYQQERWVYIVALVLSLCLSVWMDYREEVINPDGLCYLMSAQTMGVSLHEGMQLCGQAHWPLYAILIHGLVSLTHCAYTTVAYSLNGFFTLLSVGVFLRIVRHVGASIRVMWLAAGVILLAHDFNAVRVYIARDHGFWAFYLFSLLFYLQYLRKPSWHGALMWSVSMIMATLFRIEGAVFLLLAPLAVFFEKQTPFTTRLRAFLQLNALSVCAVVTIFSWIFLHPQQSLDKLGRLPEFVHQLTYGVTVMFERYQVTKAALIHYVLPADALSRAGLVLNLVLCSWYVVLLFTSVSLGYLILVFYAWASQAVRFDRQATLVLYAYIAINLLVTLGFFLEHLFLSRRYVVALSLVLMLWVPFTLDYLFSHCRTLQRRILVGVSLLLVMVAAVGGIVDFGYSKMYLRDAGAWLATHVPQDARLYANDEQVMYYSGHYGQALFETELKYRFIDTIAKGQWRHYDYLAIATQKHKAAKTQALIATIKLKPIQTFQNKRGDKVEIYRVSPSRK